MRILLVLAFVVSIAACGKKQAPQNPQTPAEEEEVNTAVPDDADDAVDMRSADPCEGGE
jgi:predicted small lipoprotein YifL